MPQKTTDRNITRTARKGAQRRGAKQNVVRQRRPGAARADGVIGDSIFNIKFAPKKGSEVYFTLKGEEATEHKPAEEMYRDLYESYERIYMLIKGEETRNVFELGVSLPGALDYMLSQLKMHLLPSGYSFNVEHDEYGKTPGKYYFVIYHPCKWPFHWHLLEVGKALQKLAKTNRPLHDLFLSFLKALRGCGIDLWDEGYMGNSVEYLEEQECSYMQEGDEDSIQELQKIRKLYEKGDAAKYKKRIVNAKTIEPGEMQRRCKLYKRDTEIANIIHQGCELIKTGCRLTHYRYVPEPPGEDEWDFFVDLDSQCNIIWDGSDYLFEVHTHFLDNDAANGYVQEAVWSMAVRPDTKEIDFLKIREEVRWPGQLAQYLGRAGDLMDKYLNKNLLINIL